MEVWIVMRVTITVYPLRIMVILPMGKCSQSQSQLGQSQRKSTLYLGAMSSQLVIVSVVLPVQVSLCASTGRGGGHLHTTSHNQRHTEQRADAEEQRCRWATLKQRTEYI